MPNRVAKIKELMPDCCIGVDVIVGFPGETREDFIDTYNFLNGLDISYLHVFTYSERENTLGGRNGRTRFPAQPVPKGAKCCISCPTKNAGLFMKLN